MKPTFPTTVSVITVCKWVSPQYTIDCTCLDDSAEICDLKWRLKCLRNFRPPPWILPPLCVWCNEKLLWISQGSRKASPGLLRFLFRMASFKHLQSSSSLVDFSPSYFKTISCNLVFVVAVFTVMLLSTMRSEVHTSPRFNPDLFLCHQRICLKILVTQQGVASTERSWQCTMLRGLTLISTQMVHCQTLIHWDTMGHTAHQERWCYPHSSGQ